MELLQMLEKKSYTVKQLSSEAYYELLEMFNCRNVFHLRKEQLLEYGLELEVLDEEVYYNVENSEHSVSYHQIYLLDNKNMVKYIVADYFK